MGIRKVLTIASLILSTTMPSGAQSTSIDDVFTISNPKEPLLAEYEARLPDDARLFVRVQGQDQISGYEEIYPETKPDIDCSKQHVYAFYRNDEIEQGRVLLYPGTNIVHVLLVQGDERISAQYTLYSEGGIYRAQCLNFINPGKSSDWIADIIAPINSYLPELDDVDFVFMGEHQIEWAGKHFPRTHDILLDSLVASTKTFYARIVTSHETCHALMAYLFRTNPEFHDDLYNYYVSALSLSAKTKHIGDPITWKEIPVYFPEVSLGRFNVENMDYLLDEIRNMRAPAEILERWLVPFLAERFAYSDSLNAPINTVNFLRSRSFGEDVIKNHVLPYFINNGYNLASVAELLEFKDNSIMSVIDENYLLAGFRVNGTHPHKNENEFGTSALNSSILFPGRLVDATEQLTLEEKQLIEDVYITLHRAIAQLPGYSDYLIGTPMRDYLGYE